MRRAGLFLLCLLAACAPGEKDVPGRNDGAVLDNSEALNGFTASTEPMPISNDSRAEELAFRAAKLRETKPAFDAAKSVDALLTFEDAANCVEGPALRHLIDSLAVYVDDMPTAGKLPEVVSGPGMIGPVTFEKHADGLTAHVVVTGQWNGIEITGLDIAYWNGGDPPKIVIRMRSLKEAARTMLNGVGFAIPANGKKEANDDGVYTTYVELVAEKETTWLRCSSS